MISTLVEQIKAATFVFHVFTNFFYQLIKVNTYFSCQQEMVSLDSLESSASEKKSKNNIN